MFARSASGAVAAIAVIVLLASAGVFSCSWAERREAHLQDASLPETQRVPTAMFPNSGPRGPSVVATVPVGPNPIGAAYDAGTGQVFVANLGSTPGAEFVASNVSVISDTTDQAMASVPVEIEPWAVAYDAATGQVFVTNIGNTTVSVISDRTDTSAATVSLGTSTYPWAMTYDAAKGEVFVASEATNNVKVISDVTDTVVATIPVGSGSDGAVYDPAKGEVFVATASDNVTGINDTTDKVVATVPVGSEPGGLAYDTAKGEVFVTGDNDVMVINDTTDKIVATVPVGSSPLQAVYDPAKGEVFVTNCGLGTFCVGSGSGNVTVINDTTDKVVAWVPVGSNPDGVAYDAAKGEVFVTNTGSNSVSVIADGSVPPAYPLRFTTSPTKCGSITFNGTTYTNGQSVLSVAGSYGVSATACTGYTLQSMTGTDSVSVSSGKARVNGTGSIVATFSPNPPSSTAGFLGLPGNDGYYVLGAAAAAVVAAAVGALLVQSRRNNQRKPSGSSGSSTPSLSQAEQFSQPAAEGQASLLTAGYCTACGQGTPPGATFCHKCGARLAPPSP